MTVRLDPKVRAAIAAIEDDAWTPAKDTDAIFDEATNTWVSKAEVAEIPFTAFGSRKASEQIRGRLVVRRIPDLNTAGGQQTLFDSWRFQAFFTTTDPDLLGTVDADKTHRGHAVIEQVHADLKNSALAHLGQVHRERRLARPGSHRIQPHPRRCEYHRQPLTGQGDHRHHSPETDHHPRPDRILGQTAEAAPTHRLAPGTCLDRAVHPDLRTTPNRDPLTTRRQRHNQEPQEHPGSEAGKSATPPTCFSRSWPATTPPGPRPPCSVNRPTPQPN